MTIIRLLTGIFSFACISGPIAASETAPPLVVHVSPSGDDAGSGTTAKPFRTLMRARDAVRERGNPAKSRIVLHKGIYYEARLVLEPRDSGLTVEASPDGRVVLSGGRPVTGWERDGAFYTARLDGVREGIWDSRALVAGDSLRERARLPKTGAFTHESVFDVRWMSTTGGGWERKPTEAELTTMKYRPGDLGPWLDLKNAEITVFHAWDESVTGIKSLDDASRTVVFSVPAGHPPGGFASFTPKARTYLVWNVREGMAPGRWYLDRTNGRVAYQPLPGEDIGRLLIVAPVMETVVSLEKGVRDVTLRGFTVTCTTTALVTGGFGAVNYSGAISGTDIENCRFDRLTVENVGGWAFKLSGRGNRISGGTIRNTGAGGVNAASSPALVSGVTVMNTGLIYPSGIGIWGDKNSRIDRNSISGTSYSAIVCGGDSTIIERNRISNVMRVLSDGGAIYITFCRHSLIRENLVTGHRLEGNAHAYYMDEQADSCVVERNISIGLAWPSHNHMTRNCTIRDNVFITGGRQMISFPRTKNLSFERNIIVADSVVFHTPPDALASMTSNIVYSRSAPAVMNILDDYSTDRTVPLEARDGTVFTDPGFVDAARGDFRFRSGSIAPGMGIRSLGTVKEFGKRMKK